jgi:hypothetical protein
MVAPRDQRGKHSASVGLRPRSKLGSERLVLSQVCLVRHRAAVQPKFMPSLAARNIVVRLIRRGMRRETRTNETQNIRSVDVYTCGSILSDLANEISTDMYNEKTKVGAKM